MRHLGQVRDLHVALDVLAQADHHRVVVAEGDLRLEHVAQADDFLVHVGDLHADRGLARDRGDDPHVGALDRVGDVLASAVTRSTLTAGPSSISYLVTVGPRLNPVTCASTWNCSSTSDSAATTMSFALVRAFGAVPGRSSAVGGSV